MSIPGKKDVLAAGGRKMVIAGGVGESPLLARIAEAKTNGEAMGEQAEPAFTPSPVPVKPRKKFNPNPGVYLVRQYQAEVQGFSNMEEALNANVDKTKVIGVQEDTSKEKPAEGIILEAGKGCLHAIGSHVVFGKYSGTEFKLNGETLLHMKDEDILGTLTDEYLN